MSDWAEAEDYATLEEVFGSPDFGRPTAPEVIVPPVVAATALATLLRRAQLLRDRTIASVCGVGAARCVGGRGADHRRWSRERAGAVERVCPRRRRMFLRSPVRGTPGLAGAVPHRATPPPAQRPGAWPDRRCRRWAAARGALQPRCPPRTDRVVQPAGQHHDDHHHHHDDHHAGAGTFVVHDEPDHTTGEHRDARDPGDGTRQRRRAGHGNGNGNGGGGGTIAGGVGNGSGSGNGSGQGNGHDNGGGPEQRSSRPTSRRHAIGCSVAARRRWRQSQRAPLGPAQCVRGRDLAALEKGRPAGQHAATSAERGQP